MCRIWKEEEPAKENEKQQPVSQKNQERSMEAKSWKPSKESKQRVINCVSYKVV